MNEREFALMDAIEDDYWWFVGKRLWLGSVVERFGMGGRILDLGCGTGGVLREISASGSCFGYDRSPAALRVCRRKGFGALARGDLNTLPFAPGVFDTVLALDVIEHLDDDLDLLRRTRELCAPGGRVIIAVPAYQFLWSRHDVTLEHRRRYTAGELTRLLAHAGFEVERTTYTNFFTFPPAALWRLIAPKLGLGGSRDDDFYETPAWLNRMLIGLYRLEARLLRRFDLPFGLSAVCVARRGG